jgi:hypothetical protein
MSSDRCARRTGRESVDRGGGGARLPFLLGKGGEKLMDHEFLQDQLESAFCAFDAIRDLLIAIGYEEIEDIWCLNHSWFRHPDGDADVCVAIVNADFITGFDLVVKNDQRLVRVHLSEDVNWSVANAAIAFARLVHVVGEPIVRWFHDTERDDVDSAAVNLPDVNDVEEDEEYDPFDDE